MSCRYFSPISLLVVVMALNSMSYADTVWIDVRSTVEHKIDHIEGDVRISHGKIVQQINKIYPNKGTKIRLYCRTGRRAERAMAALEEAGYTNVSNAGGISDARNERHLIK